MPNILLKRLVVFTKILVLGAIIVVPIHYFLLQPYVVRDNAMSPFFKKGDIILVSRIPYFTDDFRRGDIIVFRGSNNRSIKHIRRIIGLPGERISINDGILSIKNNDEKIVKELPLFGSVLSSLYDIGGLDAHEYYILGDSSFERPIGILDMRFIIGTPIIKIWPIKI